MDWDFKNSIVVGYGPTTKTHCDACKGNSRHALPNGFAYFCYDMTAKKEFVAGSECRKKIENDTRTLALVPHFGIASLGADPPTDRNDIHGKLRPDFAAASDPERLLAEMSAWVQLRQKYLPDLGFRNISHASLEFAQTAVLQGCFEINMAKNVKRTYDSITCRRPEWNLENLQKCYDVAMQIAKVSKSSSLSQSNRDFLASLKTQLICRYALTVPQIRGLNNLAVYRGEPAWTQKLQF